MHFARHLSTVPASVSNWTGDAYSGTITARLHGSVRDWGTPLAAYPAPPCSQFAATASILLLSPSPTCLVPPQVCPRNPLIVLRSRQETRFLLRVVHSQPHSPFTCSRRRLFPCSSAIRMIMVNLSRKRVNPTVPSHFVRYSDAISPRISRNRVVSKQQMKNKFMKAGAMCVR